VIKIALRATLAVIVLLVLTAVLYPLAITGIGQVAFKDKANGSLVEENGTIVGSSLIGQAWDGEQWFYGRPSAIVYDASTSSGSNLGPNSQDLSTAMKDVATAILELESPYIPDLSVATIPSDLLTASGSGLDPDISEAAALLQVPRIASVRGLSEDAVRQIVEDNVQGRALGFLGQARVNVMDLNVALERLGSQ
jgi:K+-transporting ATPase ATPase C chain